MKPDTIYKAAVGIALTVGAAIIVIVMLVILFMAMANAHDAPTGWTYPTTCCSSKDCSPIHTSDVEEVHSGYMVRGVFIPHERVQPSPDGEYHACFTKKGTLIGRIDKPACFWAPMGGF